MEKNVETATDETPNGGLPLKETTFMNRETGVVLANIVELDLQPGGAVRLLLDALGVQNTGKGPKPAREQLAKCYAADQNTVLRDLISHLPPNDLQSVHEKVLAYIGVDGYTDDLTCYDRDNVPTKVYFTNPRKTQELQEGLKAELDRQWTSFKEEFDKKGQLFVICGTNYLDTMMQATKLTPFKSQETMESLIQRRSSPASSSIRL